MVGTIPSPQYLAALMHDITHGDAKVLDDLRHVLVRGKRKNPKEPTKQAPVPAVPVLSLTLKIAQGRPQQEVKSAKRAVHPMSLESACILANAAFQGTLVCVGLEFLQALDALARVLRSLSAEEEPEDNSEASLGQLLKDSTRIGDYAHDVIGRFIVAVTEAELPLVAKLATTIAGCTAQVVGTPRVAFAKSANSSTVMVLHLVLVLPRGSTVYMSGRAYGLLLGKLFVPSGADGGKLLSAVFI